MMCGCVLCVYCVYCVCIVGALCVCALCLRELAPRRLTFVPSHTYPSAPNADLVTIRTKIERDFYSDLNQMLYDLCMVFSNAMVCTSGHTCCAGWTYDYSPVRCCRSLPCVPWPCSCVAPVSLVCPSCLRAVACRADLYGAPHATHTTPVLCHSHTHPPSHNHSLSPAP